MILSFSLSLSVCLSLPCCRALSLYFNVIFCSVQCLAGPWIRLRHGSSEAQSEKRVPGRKPLHRIIQLPPTASACAGIPMALSACAAYQQFLSTCVRHNGRRLPSMTVVAKLTGSNVLTERDVVDHALIFSCLIKLPMSAITTQDLLEAF